jgi:Lrp/AsnC family transcriptional regulator, leucine-responsive regulatory protein
MTPRVLTLKITETDLKIIKALQVDARASYTNIAQEIGVSKNIVSTRVRLLKEKGIINGSLLLINLSKFGFGCLASLSIKAIPSKVDDVMKNIRSLKGVAISASTMGSYNLIVILFMQDNEELKRNIDSIKKDPAILQIKTCILTDIEKALPRTQNIDLSRLLEA